ncbi:HET-domain-containing protein [Diaporthe amygdali]|uniref:HET-domain-containing protein n=1 Tax=Phomopsis amygdali TaxID=1214568 RepID=UPI0022FED698|nr:HET-domain-containing protein [Diaporthe amygdali]KAJ0103989.1 HET-domain-containing protein [Diaporthe amygdali]
MTHFDPASISSQRALTSIQAAVKNFRRTQGISDPNVRARLNSAFLHLSLRDFRRSIAAGCYVCRHLEDTLRAEYELRRRHKHGVAGFRPLMIARNLLARVLNWTIQHVLIPWTVHTEFVLSKIFLSAAQQYCTRRYKFWICVDSSLEIRFLPFGFERWLNTLPALFSFFDEGPFAGWAHIPFLLSPTPFDSSRANPHSDTILETRSNWTRDSTNLWRHWLNTCLETHATCRAFEQRLETYSPKRLIEVLTNTNGKVSGWRLANSSRTGTVPYFTLSHCWGSYQPLRLTKDNISSLSNSSSVQKLPKTYRDALAIVNSLGYKYIWIDSLCICQDDEEDWEKESSLMGRTYSYAICNIAATCAADGQDGLFSTRDPTTVCPTFIKLDPIIEGSSTYQVSRSNDYAYNEDITQAPLNERGWVVQERYLARRQLSATKSQFYWECHDLLASEEFPYGYPADNNDISERPWRFGATQSPRKPCLDINDEKQARQGWAELVELYSRCHLSRVTDKLVALSGLANQVQSMVDDTYLFGLWRKDLYRQLCWRPTYPTDVPRTTNSIAPTWSWANCNEMIEFDPAYYDTDHQYVSLIEVADVPSNLTEKLTLRGLALKSRISRKLRGYVAGKAYYITHLSLHVLGTQHIPASRSTEVTIYWDEEFSQEDDLNSEKWSNLQEQRSSDLLFLTVHSCRYSSGELMGTFMIDDKGNHVLKHLVSQLALRGDTKESSAADLIQTITIV